MTYQYSVAVRNAQLAALAAALPGGSAVIYTGAEPANCAASHTGTLVSTIPLPAVPFAAPSAGAMAKAGSWQDLDTVGGDITSGGYFRLLDSLGACHCQGTVGTSGTDMIIDDDVITPHTVLTITAFTIHAANS